MRDAVSVNRDRRLPRWASTVLACVAAVGVTAWGLAARYGETALAEGRFYYNYRFALAAELADARGADVVWIGDSTIMSFGGRRGYPSVLDERVLAPRGRRSAVVAAPGVDFFCYYALAAQALQAPPRVVVLIANFRLFDPRGARPRRDLLSFVPARELPRLFTLPYAMRDMSAPAALLAQCLRVPVVERGMLAYEGARLRIGAAPAWDVLGPRFPPGDAWSVEARRDRDELGHLRQYARGISVRDPMMRFAGATVAMAVERGAHVLVVVTPMPLDAMRARGLYDPERTETTIASLRTVVTASGGTLVDLHAALPATELDDVDAHFTQAGADHMAELVRRPIVLALGDVDHAAGVDVERR